jgi:hypothetical protein
VKLNNKTARKLGLLAIEVRYRANDYDKFSNDEEWQTRAGQLDRAADLLSEAARVLDSALAKDGES